MHNNTYVDYVLSLEGDDTFLPRDATQSAVMRLHMSSVRLSVTFRYRAHIG